MTATLAPSFALRLPILFGTSRTRETAAVFLIRQPFSPPLSETGQTREPWLKAHPNVQFHFTPTSASWLNQVEVSFSILQGQSLSGASFTSLKQLELHIDAYINAYNDKAVPFVWTKKKVRQRRFKDRRVTQL